MKGQTGRKEGLYRLVGASDEEERTLCEGKKPHMWQDADSISAEVAGNVATARLLMFFNLCQSLAEIENGPGISRHSRPPSQKAYPPI